jgi:hypothetical protein
MTEIVWKPIATAPRDGTWFIARTEKPEWGATRLAHFARPDDRLPLTNTEDMWPSAPTEWTEITS